MPKASQVNPSLPVWDTTIKQSLMAEATPFFITRVSAFKSPRYGPTWRAYCTLAGGSRDSGILLFAANAVRDETFGGFAAALADDADDPIGPCILIYNKLPNGRDTWEIGDAPEGDVKAKAK